MSHPLVVVALISLLWVETGAFWTHFRSGMFKLPQRVHMPALSDDSACKISHFNKLRPKSGPNYMVIRSTRSLQTQSFRMTAKGETAIGYSSSIDISKYPKLFLAGGLCAAITHGVTVPIDLVKTSQQV